jgi:hypothetical protein
MRQRRLGIGLMVLHRAGLMEDFFHIRVLLQEISVDCGR